MKKALKMLINNVNLMKKSSITLPNDNKKVYICSSMNEMKTVNFQIEGKYIDQIKSGTKTEDYRSVSVFNTHLLCEKIEQKDLTEREQHVVVGKKETWRLKKDLTHVRFVNGYRSIRKELTCEIKGMNIDNFVKNMPDGVTPGCICFTIELGQIIESKNFDHGKTGSSF